MLLINPLRSVPCGVRQWPISNISLIRIAPNPPCQCIQWRAFDHPTLHPVLPTTPGKSSHLLTHGARLMGMYTRADINYGSSLPSRTLHQSLKTQQRAVRRHILPARLGCHQEQPRVTSLCALAINISPQGDRIYAHTLLPRHQWELRVIPLCGECDCSVLEIFRDGGMHLVTPVWFPSVMYCYIFMQLLP